MVIGPSGPIGRLADLLLRRHGRCFGGVIVGVWLVWAVDCGRGGSGDVAYGRCAGGVLWIGLEGVGHVTLSGSSARTPLGLIVWTWCGAFARMGPAVFECQPRSFCGRSCLAFRLMPVFVFLSILGCTW